MEYGSFKGITFENEPQETTPLSADILNLIQKQIQTALENKFNAKYEVIDNVSTALIGGIYNVGKYASGLPFASAGTNDWLIVINVKGSELVTQIAIDNATSNIWYRSEITTTSLTASWTNLKITNINTKAEYNTLPYTIDNKPVYMKRIKINSFPNATVVDYATGIEEFQETSVNIIKMEGMMRNIEENSYFPLIFAHPIRTSEGALYDVSIYFVNDSIRITTATDRSGYDGFVDVYYQLQD